MLLVIAVRSSKKFGF